MSVITGLKAMKARAEQEEAARSGGDRVKVTWAQVPNKGAVKVRFLQELDADSPNYSAKNGLAVLNVEHAGGQNWKRKASCTMEEEGRCYACEKVAAGEKGWGQKSRLYVNVLVDNGQDEPFVAVLSQSFSSQSITPSLLEQAEEMETITDRWFKIKKNGEKKDTTYVLTALRELDSEQPKVEDFELFDLNDALIKVPYERQSAHYHKGEQASDTEAKPVAAATAADEW